MIKEKKTILVISLSATFMLLAIFLFSYIYYLNNYQDKLLPRSFLASHDISGMNRSNLAKLIESEEARIRSERLRFVYNGESVYFPLSLQSANPEIPSLDLKYSESINFNKEDNVNLIFKKENRTYLNFLRVILNKSSRNNFYLNISYSPEILEEWLKDSFEDVNIEPENAYFSLDSDLNLISNPEKIGKEINKGVLGQDLIYNFSRLENQQIEVKTKSKYPTVSQKDLEPLSNIVQNLVKNGSLKLYFPQETKEKKDDLSFSLKAQDYVPWINGLSGTNPLSIRFDNDKIRRYLNENITKSINQEVSLPRFDVQDGKVLSWQLGKDGRELDMEKTINNIELALNSDDFVATIVAKEIKVADFNIENDFKIKDLIGTGESNFAGSSKNRRHNIKVGADAVHGLLIKPGEEFSLVENLGEIDAASGYLPELVIKGNETIPEYGGGLCQVATTIFRSALGTGLPITARRNHSYRVSYYEPAGMDASVYDPWPDIKFLNDTDNYVLIQSRIEGDILHFDFWGTDDGRVATTTKPVLYNIVAPPPTKLIETDTLAPGQKRCTESAHYGADAYFDYTVIYPEGATSTPLKEVRFKSHYVPWQEVCLIGKKEVVEEDEVSDGDGLLEDNLNEEDSVLNSDNLD